MRLNYFGHESLRRADDPAQTEVAAAAPKRVKPQRLAARGFCNKKEVGMSHNRWTLSITIFGSSNGVAR
jgi:hypothetical protein